VNAFFSIDVPKLVCLTRVTMKILSSLQTLLLLGILALLGAIYHCLPQSLPTDLDFTAASKDFHKLRLLESRIPCVSVRGSVSVVSDDPLEVQATMSPLEVQMFSPVTVRTDQRDPLDVKISQ
jgi:hypothetical protein